MHAIVSRSILAAALAAAALAALPLAAPGQQAPKAQPTQAEEPSATDRPVIRSYNVADLLRAPNDYPLDPNLLPTTASVAAQGDPAGGGTAPRGGFGYGAPGGGYPGMMPGMGGMYGGRGMAAGGAPGAAMAGMMGAPGGGGGGGEGQPDEPPHADKVSPLTMDALIRLIVDTVDPDSWRDNGGSIGDIRGLGTSIVVTNTPAAQKEIETLLTEVRKSEGPSAMVSIDAYWVLLTPDELTSLTKASAEPNSGMSIKYDAIDKSKTYSRARTVGFSGQTVHVLSGRARSFVTGVEPVVGTGAIGYQVQTRLLHGGVALQVTPRYIHTDNQDSVILDLWSVVSEMTPPAAANNAAGAAMSAIGAYAESGGNGGGGSGGLGAGSTTQPVAGGGMKVPAIDRPAVVAQQLRTTARIPIRKKVLLGGMTMEPTGAADAPADGGRQLYLVVEANVDR